MRPAKWLCAWLLSIVTATLNAASACSLASDYTPPTVEAKSVAAGVVILGKAIKNVTETSTFNSTKIVEVSQWLKGGGPRYVTVIGFGSDSACKSNVELEQMAIFYGKLDRSSGIINLQYLGAFDAIDGIASAPRVAAAVKSLPSSPATAPIQEGK